jgi:hypothetical protein
MSALFDEMARTLASPMPRRKAFKLLLGGVLGGVFAPYALAACNTAGCRCTISPNSCDTGLTCVSCKSGNTACVPAGKSCCVDAGNSGNAGSSLLCNTGQCCCPSQGTCSSSTGTACTNVSGCSIL